MKILKNTTVSDIFISDVGVMLKASSEYTIPPQDYALWIQSSDVVEKIGSDEVIVNYGDDDILNKKIAIAIIQENTTLIHEYFTLMQEDGILMGNGQILFLDDEFYTTDNAVDYNDDEEIEDDVPTND